MERLPLFAVAAILSVCLCGCTASDSEPESTANAAPTPMPDVVFLSVVSHCDYEGYDVAFFDSGGDYYCRSYDSYASSKTVLEEFNGDPESFSKLGQTCDVSELQSNYQIVYELANSEGYDLDYPTSYPDVEADTKYWYGLYYGTDGELRQLLLHLSECSIGVSANDERANGIYAWFEESIRKD